MLILPDLTNFLQNDALDGAAVRALLDRPDLLVRVYPSLSSTNDTAKQLARQGVREAIVLAEAQTGGRGRRGRSFFSPRGSGLYWSILLARSPLADPALLTAAVAICAAEAIEDLTGLDIGIKWVNDLLVHGKKICGILAETVSGTEPFFVIGIGVNICPPDGGLPPEIAGSAGALFASCEECPPNFRNRLSAALANRILDIDDSGFLPEYRRRSVVVGREVMVFAPSGSYPAAAVEIDDSARLVIRKADGSTEALSSGEISIRICDNHE